MVPSLLESWNEEHLREETRLKLLVAIVKEYNPRFLDWNLSAKRLNKLNPVINWEYSFEESAPRMFVAVAFFYLKAINIRQQTVSRLRFCLLSKLVFSFIALRPETHRRWRQNPHC